MKRRSAEGDDRAADPPISARNVRRLAAGVLAAYAVALAAMAFWPTHVDIGVRPMLSGITRMLPALTYERMEFGANILLFVPMGALLAVILARRELVVPIAVVTSVAIESLQAILLDNRTPSVLDVIANLAGACLGLLVIAVHERWRRHRGQTQRPRVYGRPIP